MTEWLAQIVGGTPTVSPIGDLREHVMSERCWCKPFWDGNVLVHNSADQREKFETGQRKPS
jgi:hypothetical protein